MFRRGLEVESLMSFSLWFTFFRLFLGDSYGCTRQEILPFLQRLCLPAERFVNVLQGAPILNVILITCSDEPDLFKIPEQGSKNLFWPHSLFNQLASDTRCPAVAG